MTNTKIKNMEQFASVSGISRPTISKYFHDPSSVRESTRKKIEGALARYNYRPNIYAINQNRRSTKTIGIMVPQLMDPFFAEIARKIEVMCLDAGFRPLLLSSHGDAALENDNLDTLRALKSAGAMIAPLGEASDRSAIEQICVDVPTVLFDSEMDGLEAAFIGSNNRQSVALMVDYLCHTGEPPCFFEMASPPNPNALKRRRAYLDAVQAAGEAPNVVQVEGEGWEFEDIGYRGGIGAIERRSFATNTVLCSNDRLAIGLLAAAYEKGLRVGTGSGCAIRIAGHDDHPYARYTCPPLTTVTQDYTAIATLSFQTLMESFDADGAAPAYRSVLFDGRLVLRQSA